MKLRRSISVFSQAKKVKLDDEKCSRIKMHMQKTND